MADGGFAPRSMKRKNVKGLALTPAAPKPPPTAESRPGHAGGGKDDEQLEIGIEFALDLKPEDLEIIKDLGAGNGGTVSKVKHLPTNTVMARKIIHVEAKREMRKRIVRELQIMHGCHSEHIVTFYGALLNENNDVIMCMEYMDVGSLDRVSRVFGPIRVDVLGKIAEATLGGLTYLYSKHHIMHRDIKPSNILVNSRGSIKLCDFGVSGELVNSIADTFVGTSTYMAPERIQGEKYTVKSDVWSYGLTIMELAIGKFPFAAADQLEDAESAPAGILDLLQQIVHEPAPRLPKSDAFPQILDDMIQKCLFKEPERRPTPQELYDRDSFVQAAKRTPVDLREWACSLMDRDNRKSHLAPQLSPATQELLREQETPTSGEIPILGTVVSPRDQLDSLPTRPAPSRTGSSSLGRSSGENVHSGLGSRVVTTTTSVPRSRPAVNSTQERPPGRTGSPSTGAPTSHYGLPPRPSPSTRAPPSAPVPVRTHSPSSSNAGNPAGFSLPLRPAPPSGPLPPAPHRRQLTAEDIQKENRRRAGPGPSSNGQY
ncbi:kinase-like domain-containing protein [Cladorrhinum sp. PSN259]|nr:kinase-like domain-containing protein [Cladorrhinum sp. PSN259]